MPMNWTPEANAKLFLGVLEQLKEQNMKLSNGKLAEYMGPDCTTRSVDSQMAKLKKQAMQQDSGVQSGPATPSTPAATPKKRRTGTPKKGSPSKKAKQAKESEESAEELEKMILGEHDEVKQEQRESEETEMEDVAESKVKVEES